MPNYLIQVAYTPEAWASMVKHPQDRMALVTPAIEGLGGKVEAGYLAFGEYDLVCIAEFPDNTSAAGFSMSVAAKGAVKSLRTTPLLTMAEGVAAQEKASTSTYAPPK